MCRRISTGLGSSCQAGLCASSGYSIGRDVIIYNVPPDRIGEGSPTPARQWDQKENMKRYRVVLTVHDSIVCCVKEENTEEAQQYIEECMKWTPDWASGLPVDCESGIGKSYGDCE